MIGWWYTSEKSCYFCLLLNQIGCFLLNHDLTNYFYAQSPLDKRYWYISAVLSLSHVQFFATPWTTAYEASLSFTSSWSLLTFMPIELVMLSNHLIFCCPLLLWPSIFPSIRVFSSEWVSHIRWPNIGVLASVLSMNIKDGFPLGLTGLISLQFKVPQESSQAPQLEASILWYSAILLSEII